MSTLTPMLQLLPDGQYVAYGSYASCDEPVLGRPLESFFALSRTEVLLVFEGSFSTMGGPKQGFKLELEVPSKEAGKGYFVFGCASAEIKGVLGTTEDAFMLAGRSKEPALQLAAHLRLHDPQHLSLQGLVAYEDFKWITWSVSVKTYDPQMAKASVLALPKRA